MLVNAPLRQPLVEIRRRLGEVVRGKADVIDLLREEIRGAGSVSDELVETLSGELKALRRRIRLRAEGEIFSDEQLEIIAAAVANKLAD